MGNIGLAVERTNCGFIAEDAKICLDAHFPFPTVVNHKHHSLRRDILLSRAVQVPVLGNGRSRSGWARSPTVKLEVSTAERLKNTSTDSDSAGLKPIVVVAGAGERVRKGA